VSHCCFKLFQKGTLRVPYENMYITLSTVDHRRFQVYSGSKEDAGDGEWVPVRPVPGSLTINTGDMMQVRAFLCTPW
jgi:hypothetical protein